MNEPHELYAERIKRVEDAIQLKVPDRVPFLPFFTFFPAKYAGISFRDAMYDYEKLKGSWKKTITDLEPDMYNGFIHIAFGRTAEILDCKSVQWPGKDLGHERPFQFVEGEYMTADEYDDFIFDPTDFTLRKFLPRSYGTLEPLGQMFYFPSLYYTRFMSGLGVLGSPEVAGAFESLVEAGVEAQKITSAVAAFGQEITAMGYPAQFGATAYSPFDYIADLLRGTKGAMLDMFRVPDKLLEALEKTTMIVLRGAIRASEITGNKGIFIPLHKCIDNFMSQEQFEKFFWPSLKKVILELIERGMTPWVFWEGNCSARLETIRDIPKGKAVYWFEQTDLFKAKEILGDRVCLRGNVPASLLCVGSPDEVRDYCKRLIDHVGKDGGFIMDGGAGIPDDARPENVIAMAEVTREYGTY